MKSCSIKFTTNTKLFKTNKLKKKPTEAGAVAGINELILTR